MSAESRFHSRYEVDPETGCWLWTGRLNAAGYACIDIGNCGSMLAHRYSYQLAGNDLPETLDHSCRVRRCVNPGHLRPATRSQQAAYRSRPNKTGYKGIAKSSHGHGYQARIKVAGVSRYLGYFQTAAEAAAAYADAARAAHGEFAWCDTVPGRMTVTVKRREASVA